MGLCSLRAVQEFFANQEWKKDSDLQLRLMRILEDLIEQIQREVRNTFDSDGKPTSVQRIDGSAPRRNFLSQLRHIFTHELQLQKESNRLWEAAKLV